MVANARVIITKYVPWVFSDGTPIMTPTRTAAATPNRIQAQGFMPNLTASSALVYAPIPKKAECAIEQYPVSPRITFNPCAAITLIKAEMRICM